MVEYYSTVKENGYDYALEIAEKLRQQGYKVLSVSDETLVPRGCDGDGRPIMVPGYEIKVDDGRPPYRSIITGKIIRSSRDL